MLKSKKKSKDHGFWIVKIAREHSAIRARKDRLEDLAVLEPVLGKRLCRGGDFRKEDGSDGDLATTTDQAQGAETPMPKRAIDAGSGTARTCRPMPPLEEPLVPIGLGGR